MIFRGAMKTVKMRRGDFYADICDSPETIRQAESEGYVLVEEPKVEAPQEIKESRTQLNRHRTGGSRKMER